MGQIEKYLVHNDLTRKKVSEFFYNEIVSALKEGANCIWLKSLRSKSMIYTKTLKSYLDLLVKEGYLKNDQRVRKGTYFFTKKTQYINKKILFEILGTYKYPWFS